MTKTEVDRFRAVLTTTVAELVRTRNRDGIRLERSADQLDEVQAASQCALAVCSLDREFNQLRDARAALRRIQEGNFGICQECEEEIHPKRLAAVPWATFCIRCQERVVLADDRLDDVACKLEHFRKVIDARAAADAALAEFRRLNGGL